MKITDIQAACGFAQLSKLNDFIKMRQNILNLLKKT